MLLVDKPAGITSHDVVAQVRRATGERRIGHAGTLDPFATGLLVLLLGKGTRLLPYVDGEPKLYEAEIVFGAETATDDLTGDVVRTALPPERATVEGAIGTLTGAIEQLPPAYSAKKVGGRRAYEAARRGEEMALHPVPVTVHEWEMLDWRPDAVTTRITCGGGTYIRALARDLGRATGSAAHLRSLRRLASGPFHVRDAATTEELGAANLRPLPLYTAVRSLPVERLDDEAVRRIGHGLRVPARAIGPRAALMTTSNDLLAIAERVDEEWQPRVVLL